MIRAAPRARAAPAVGRRVAPVAWRVVRRPTGPAARVPRPVAVTRRGRSPGRGWRRPYYRRYGRWWDWGAPWPYWADEPGEPWPDEPGEPWPGEQWPGEPAGGVGGIGEPARRALARAGLSGGVWRGRPAATDPEPRRFLDRFHGVAGIGQLAAAYHGDRYQRAVDRMAMRLGERLAARDHDFRRGLHFERRIAFAPDGQPILTLTAHYRGVAYRFFPWRRLRAAALRRQLRRDRLVFGSPERVRWVFDRRLAPSAAALAGQLRGALGRAAAPALGRMVVVL